MATEFGNFAVLAKKEWCKAIEVAPGRFSEISPPAVVRVAG
jgi:hypothetical protein